MNKEKYLKQLNQYLMEQNYRLLKVRTSYRESLEAIPLSDKTTFNEKGKPLNYDFTFFYSENALIDFAINKKNELKIPGYPVNDLIGINAFHKIFNDANKEEKLGMLKDIESYISNMWRMNFIEFFNGIINSPKEAIEYIHSIPISTWEVYKIPLEDLDKLIISKGLEGKDYDNFYLKFFKARKNQIKDATYGPKVKDFLLDKYAHNEEKLKPYCVFFNHVKELFEEIDLDILEPMAKITVTSRINVRKAAQLLCMPKYDEKEINKLITSFIHLMKPHKRIKQTYVDDIASGMIEIRCYTDNPFTQDELNKEIKDYLLFKKKNIDIPTDAQNIEKYFMSKELQSELGENKQVTKKMKL